MRVVAWQNACKQWGGDRGLARPCPAMTGTASFAAGRSFGIHHNYIERPWGPGGASSG
ncbi:MAG TPA: hypothetical protein VNT52_10515 [Acidimicrobiales bacterium]|nr:hypothetical protein [Acidimicrobiales bacterium]